MLKRIGIEPKTRKLTEEDKQEITMLYEEGSVYINKGEKGVFVDT